MMKLRYVLTILKTKSVHFYHMSAPQGMTSMSGCESLKHLWEVAKLCNIDKPGIVGAPTRAYNFVQCGNVRNFMTMAMMKCWEERGSTEPPLVINDTRTIVRHHKTEQTQTKKANYDMFKGGSNRP